MYHPVVEERFSPDSPYLMAQCPDCLAWRLASKDRPSEWGHCSGCRVARMHSNCSADTRRPGHWAYRAPRDRGRPEAPGRPCPAECPRHCHRTI